MQKETRLILRPEQLAAETLVIVVMVLINTSNCYLFKHCTSEKINSI